MVLDQVIFAGSNNPLSNSATEYNRINAISSDAWTGTESIRQRIVAADVTFKNLRVELTGSPLSGNSYAFTVMKNGGATALTLTISDSETQKSDTVNTVGFSAGDTVSLRCVPTSTPSVRDAKWSCVATSANATDSVLIGGFSATLSTGTRFNFLETGDLWDTTESRSEAIVSRSGTLKNLYVNLTVAPGAGTSRSFTVRINGADSSITLSIADTATSNSDLVNTATVSAGDRVTIESTITGAAVDTIVMWGTVFVSDVDDEYIVLGGSNNPLSNSATEYNLILGSDSWNATESDRTLGGQSAARMKNLYINLTGAPGTGNSYAFMARRNAGDTSLTTTVSDVATTNNDTSNSFVISNFDDLALQVIPASTPDVADARWGFTIDATPVVSAKKTNILTTMSKTW